MTSRTAAAARCAALATSLALLLGAGCRQVAPPATGRLSVYDDAPYARVLAASVREGLVDYAAVRANQEDLDRYLDGVARFGPRMTSGAFGSDAAQLAYRLNAYNALVLRRALDAGAGDGRGDAKRRVDPPGWFFIDRHRVDGGWTTLDDLEKNEIRTVGDPRIHFALVCGAISCPRLLDEPYDPERLDAQLEAQGRAWLSAEGSALVVAEDGSVGASEIFFWFEEDFEPWGGLAEVVRRYVPEEDPRRAVALAAIEAGAVERIPYDWTLNAVPGGP